jgi:xylulokinase
MTIDGDGDVNQPGDLILAIDLGTSAIKVVVFDLLGKVVASAERDTTLRHPEPTWIESDAESWWVGVTACIRQVLDRATFSADAIRAVGVCGFMHSLVPVDRAGQVLCPPILWPDQRCAGEVEALARHADTFVRIMGRPANTMSSVPRLQWLVKHRPEVMARASSFLLPKDFLRLRLTGEIATDERDASGTGLIDARSGSWSEELLDLAGVTLGVMPAIRASDDLAGTITTAAAEATGLRAGTPVVVGSGDWFSTIAGSGCYLPDRACLYLGTAGIIGAFTSAAEQDRLGDTAYFGSVTSTGSALRWIREVFGGPTERLTYAAIFGEAETSVPGARGLYFLPHLMGERGGTMRPNARGTLSGLTLAHRRADIFRAVIDGTAMWLRTTTEPYLAKHPIGDFLILGGGSRSPLWRKIVAAVYNRRLLVPRVLEGGALGVAMMAAVGAGLRSGYRTLADEWVQIESIEVPDAELVARYGEIYCEFQLLEAATRGLEARVTSGDQ